jgi:pimeloyl-ACP methyl ester carboxylesterase
MLIEPFTIAISDEAIEDLKRRLEATRFPDDFANDDWRYGTPTAYLKSLVDYWLGEYDWRAAEREMNGFRHFRADLDGVPVHFIHQKSKVPGAIPLIVSHGWPWCFWDMRHIIGPLTDPAAHGGDPADAFDVIVPSLPGFGFSTPLRTPGINWWRTADLWQKLMTEGLGHERYGASGGDWGALVTAQLGHKYAASLYGVHMMHAIPLTLFNTERPWDITGGALVPPAIRGELREALHARQRRIASHVAVQVLDPQTLANGLNDSPAGLLSWLVERRRAWGDTHGDVESRFPKEHLITTTMLYWLTGSVHTSARYYAEAARHPWTPSHDRMPAVEAPTGLTFLGGEKDPAVDDPVAAFQASERARVYNLHQVTSHPTGGHFGHYEEPGAVVDAIRCLFRALR